MWEQILGFFAIIFRAEFTIGLWANSGVPLWLTFIYVFFYTSLTLSLTYFGTGWIENFLVKRGLISKKTAKKLRMWWKNNNNHSVKSGFSKRLNSWLKRQKGGIVLACGFIPFVPVLPTLVYIISRLADTKRAFLILLAGNFFRNFILCLSIYQGISLLS